jgi:hypothetical protein
MKRKTLRGLRVVGVATALVMPLLAVFPMQAANANVAGAGFTTDDPGFTGPSTYVNQPCNNGPTHTTPSVNCNIYLDKRDVWINGGPTNGANHLTDGTYFFAVLVPGTQPDPNDGSSGNLSSSNDPYTNRTFTVSGGKINAYSGTHQTDNQYNDPNSTPYFGRLIQLFPYDDTTNPGGVYIMAVCSLGPDGNSYPVKARDCKYDAFKVKPAVAPPAQPLVVTKSVSGAIDREFAWGITKTACAHGTSGTNCPTTVKQIGGTAQFDYTVHVTHDGGTLTNAKVSGDIFVTNPNDQSVTGVEVDDSVSDSAATCSISADGGITYSASPLTGQTIPPGQSDFPYICTWPVNTTPNPYPTETNTVTATWPDQNLDSLNNPQDPCGMDLCAGSAPFSVGFAFTESQTDNCVDVTDPVPNGGTSSTPYPFPQHMCVGDTTPTADGGAGTGSSKGFTFTYSVAYNVPANDCTSYTNTATATDNSDPHTPVTGSPASVTVTVCGPAKTGALTIGFWKTTNGQNLVKYYCQNPALANYLNGLGSKTGPFAAPTTSCTDLASYVSTILKGASATNMNIMLRAQMMGTGLDVWFSGPGWTSAAVKVSGTTIKPPSNFFKTQSNLGTFKMDTTAICPMVDNTTTGTAICQGGFPSTDAVASGAVPSSPMVMQDILDFAATTTNATFNGPFNGNVTTPIWYSGATGQKTKEEILKNIFDQFNNGDAFGSF